MASYGVSITLEFMVWNFDSHVGQTGDAGNLTLRWVKDGTSSAPANSPAEVDATNAPGLYKLVLTATECQCKIGTLGGKSSTSYCAVIPETVTFEQPADIADAVLDEAASGHTGVIATNLDAAVSTRSTLTQAQVLSDTTPFAGANVAAIKAKTDNLPANPAAVGSAMTLASGAITADVIATGAIDADAIADNAIDAGAIASNAITSAKIATDAIDADALAADAIDEILDEVVEGTYTMRHYLRLFASMLLGEATGGNTTTITFRDTGDSKNRIVMTVDADGNRSAVTLTGT